jgi:hypothetical protein
MAPFPAYGCLEKWSFRPSSALYSKFYPWDINYMPAVKFSAGLDFGTKIFILQKAQSIWQDPRFSDRRSECAATGRKACDQRF